MPKTNWGSFETLVNEFCNKVARMADGYREMRAYYIFWDKRPGTPAERFEKDADNHAEYTRMFQA